MYVERLGGTYENDIATHSQKKVSENIHVEKAKMTHYAAHT